jgi:hypothetical protein
MKSFYSLLALPFLLTGCAQNQSPAEPLSCESTIDAQVQEFKIQIQNKTLLSQPVQQRTPDNSACSAEEYIVNDTTKIHTEGCEMTMGSYNTFFLFESDHLIYKEATALQNSKMEALFADPEKNQLADVVTVYLDPQEMLWFDKSYDCNPTAGFTQSPLYKELTEKEKEILANKQNQ